MTGTELEAGFTFRGAIKKIVWRQKELMLNVKDDDKLFTFEVPEGASVRVLEPPEAAEKPKAEK